MKENFQVKNWIQCVLCLYFSSSLIPDRETTALVNEVFEGHMARAGEGFYYY